MIDGLKLTFSGETLRTMLEQRTRRHEEDAGHWTRETLRAADDGTEDAPLLPHHMCENEAERHSWRARVLALIRDHIDAGETYRLDAADLEYGELLPQKPRWMVQDEYEEQTRIGFNLERLVKSLDGSGVNALSRTHRESTRHEFGDVAEAVIDETDEFRTTRIDVEDGPEIIKIERK